MMFMFINQCTSLKREALINLFLLITFILPLFVGGCADDVSTNRNVEGDMELDLGVFMVLPDQFDNVKGGEDSRGCGVRFLFCV